MTASTDFTRRFVRVAVACVLGIGSLALAGCSSSGDGGNHGMACPAKVDFEVRALDSMRFNPETLEAKAGKVIVKLVNDGAMTHNFKIRGFDGTAAVDAGDQKERCVEFTLTPGKYTFYCGISGHEAAGMKGKLTVS